MLGSTGDQTTWVGTGGLQDPMYIFTREYHPHYGDYIPVDRRSLIIDCGTDVGRLHSGLYAEAS